MLFEITYWPDWNNINSVIEWITLLGQYTNGYPHKDQMSYILSEFTNNRYHENHDDPRIRAFHYLVKHKIKFYNNEL